MRICDLAWSLWVICCMRSFCSWLGPMLISGKFLWQLLHFHHGYITCLYVPLYLAGDACAQIVAILLFYVSLLACRSAFCIFEKHMLVFVDLIHALPTRGRKVANSCSQGELCIEERNSCIWELLFAWILVVLFCQWCRALLPQLEESVILEHFISVVSSRYPFLRGPRSFSLKWSFLGFCLAFWSLPWFFLFFLFFFSFFSKLVTCLCCQYTHQGEIEDRSVRGPVDGRSCLWWVIHNVVWTDSWLSIAGAGYGLICVGAGEEWVRKVYALRGLRGVERQVGLTWGTQWPAWSSAGRMVARKARRSCQLVPVQGSGSQPKSTRGLYGSSPENRRVTWLSHKTRTGGSAGGDGMWARREASMPADAWRDRRAFVGRTWSAAMAWSCDEEECYMTYLPLRGCITT
jgi:hypothetical protein